MKKPVPSHPAVSAGLMVSRCALVATLAFTTLPTAAIAVEAGTELSAVNNESAPAPSENNKVSSADEYSLAVASALDASSDAYDLSTIDLSKIADGDYYGTAHVAPTDDDSNEWEEYDITVKVSFASGKITAVAVTEESWDKLPKESESYLNMAEFDGSNIRVDGVRKHYPPVTQNIIDANNTNVDVTASATRSSIAIKEATYNALTKAYADQNPSGPDKPVEDEYTYGYVGLSWSEYWAAEGVYAAGDTTSSDELDSHGEYDKGAFDTVSRATKNHGLHRGNYQCEVVIHTESGKDVEMAYWIDKTSFMTTGGETVGFSGGTLTFADGTTDTMVDYDNVGIKYVPVKVKTADLDALKATHSFVANGEEMRGGYGENSLQSYVVTADVDAATYGLKTATNNGGSFSFSARSATGTDSGLKDQALKTASSGINVVQKSGTEVGTYGEFIRVDLTGDYGDLGANMQAVTWTYYGDDASRTTAKATFGTKFAADNWMHKSNGIQLGLTDSLRCQLPEGTDGTGYWTVTVHALGYQDYSFDIEATADNIAKDETPVTDATKTALQALYDKAAALNEADYTSDSWSSFVTERDETRDLLAKEDLLESEASEQLTHLQSAIDSLKVVEGRYVLMNIPYDAFYKAELSKNDVPVDGFTSATLNKTRTGNLVGGSYHVDPKGSDITGITFPVQVGEGVDVTALAEKLGAKVVTDDSSVDVTVTNKGNTTTTTYTGSGALFEAPSYSYYVSSKVPSFYKVLTLDDADNPTFSEVKGADGNNITPTELTDIKADLSTESSYGDYQLDFDDNLRAALFGTTTAEDGTVTANSGSVYAVTINTTDGTSYGLRHMENVWRTTELAWSTGFTTQVHNCPTSSEHYKSMMGKTISSVTYYAETGVYTIPVENLYVPIKFDVSDAAVENAQKGDGSTKVTLPTLPEGFEAAYAIAGWNGNVEVKDGKLTIPSGQANGAYTLVVSDANNTYAEFTVDFQIKADASVTFDADKLALTGKDLEAFVKAITSVSVDGTSYAAAGRGAKVIVNEDGTLNVTGDVLAALENGEHRIVVTATGYNDVTFTYTKQADKTALTAAIASAGKLDKDDYTATTWTKLQDAIEAAQAVASDVKATDEQVSSAIKSVDDAVAALVDISELNDAIAQAADLKQADYTSASWSAYQAKLAAAKKVATNDSATAEQVATATSELNDAYDALAKKATQASKDELQNAVDEAGKVEKGSYTDATWNAFQAALETAKKVAANDDASQAEVDQAQAALKAAKAALATPSAGGTTDTTTNGSTNGTKDTTTKTNTTSGANSTKKSALPQTGDETPAVAGAVAGVGVALVAAAVAIRRRILG